MFKAPAVNKRATHGRGEIYRLLREMIFRTERRSFYNFVWRVSLFIRYPGRNRDNGLKLWLLRRNLPEELQVLFWLGRRRRFRIKSFQNALTRVLLGVHHSVFIILIYFSHFLLLFAPSAASLGERKRFLMTHNQSDHARSPLWRTSSLND